MTIPVSDIRTLSHGLRPFPPSLAGFMLGLCVLAFGASLSIAAAQTPQETQFLPFKTAPAPGKALIYVYRQGSMVGAAGHPMVFVNGDFLAVLRNSNYASVEVPNGSVEIIAPAPIAGTESFPPPGGEWLSELGCQGLNWRRLATIQSPDLQRCRTALIDLFRRCGITVEIRPPLKITRTPYCNYKLYGGADEALWWLDQAVRHPQDFYHKLGIDVEADKIYYVQWSVSSFGGKMKLVDEATGAKKISRLHPAKDR